MSDVVKNFCRIEERWAMDGVALHLGRGDGTRVMYGPGGLTSHLITDPTGPTPDGYEPALIVSEDMARAILQALSNHFGGAEDSRALRRDYDAERSRVDKLTDAVIGLAASHG